MELRNYAQVPATCETNTRSHPLKTIFLPFEGTEMPIPVGYDAYLSTAFGDYMTPPPTDKKVPHHDAIIADMDKSYTE